MEERSPIKASAQELKRFLEVIEKEIFPLTKQSVENPTELIVNYFT